MIGTDVALLAFMAFGTLLIAYLIIKDANEVPLEP